MVELEIYRSLARYNRWMNERLLEVCASLSDEERKRHVGAPFGSIHGTWNHVLLADQVWLGRFIGPQVTFKSLSEEIHADFEALRQHRAEIDTRIETWVETLTPQALLAPFTYVSMVTPKEYTFPFYACVTHFFNHQTHHRGQLTTLLEQRGVDFGVTDYMMLPGLAL